MATKKTLLQQAQELNEKKEYQAVIDLLPDTVLQAENSADLYAEKAQTYYRLKDNLLCEEMADKALVIDSNNAKANHYKGNIYDDLEEYDRAIACYKRAIEANPNFEYPYNGLGNAFIDKQEYDKAIKCYRKAIEINPNFEYSYNGLGNAYYDQKEYDEAIQWYLKAIEVNPKYDAPYHGLGNAYSNKEEYDKAIQWYLKAIALNPKFDYPYNGLGNAYSNKEEYDKAIQWYLKAIEVNPKFDYPYNGLGNAYSNKKEYDEGIRWYLKAIEVNPKYDAPYYGLGFTYYDKEEYDEAIRWYGKAIAVNPKYAAPYNGLGNAYSKKQEYDEAIQWYRKAIDVNPKYDHPYSGLGSAYHSKGEYNKALQWYKKAIEANPQYANVFYNRALLSEYMGEPDKALVDYERYVELANDKASYYAQRANERIAELKKNIKNPRLGSIAELVADIKKLLLFSDGNITHYTSLSAAKILILDAASRFRLSEGAFLNDTSEGRELFTYLDFQAKPRKSNDIEALPFATKPFIGSFVAETKHDDLTLWRMYGKEEKEEAKGCAITMHQQQLVASIQNEVTSNKQGLGIKQDEAFSFYRVAYIGHDKKFILPGASEKEAELNGYMLDLAGKLGKKPKTTEEERQDIIKHLNEIAFLFKTIEYQHEQELRLVLDGIGSEKKVDTSGTMPRVYIELVNIRPLIQKITIGPKVERGDEWAAAFYYSLDKDGLRPEICISHLPYK